MTCAIGGESLTYTNNPLESESTIIHAADITELRTAVNQARAHAGLSTATWTDTSLSAVSIKAVHITELRTKLDEARASLGLSAATYTDATLSGIAVKAVHLTELRARVAEAQSAIDIRWMVTDQLGTPRIILDQTGSLANVSRHDYLPFGEELFDGTGARNSTLGYTNDDAARQKFTQKERDIETGLDYFLARYHSSTQGRFTSPDEFIGGPDELYYFAEDASANPTFYADLRKPQSLNKYQYSFNNPLRYVDPDGHDPEEPEPPQKPKPVIPVPVPVGPGLPVPIPVPIGPALAGPTDQQIIRGVESVLDTVCDVTGITALADWLRPKIMPTPAQPTTATPPSPRVQPVPPPPITMGKGSTKDERKVNQGRSGSAKSGANAARAERDRLRASPNKTPEVKEALRRAERELQRQIDRMRKSEPHGRKPKGNQD